MYRIRFLSGRLRGRMLRVEEPVITIGSAADCAVRLTEPGIADHHLQCRHEGRDLVLVRLGSAPVTVDGRALEVGEAVSVRRARVRIGSLELKFEVTRRLALPHTSRSVSVLEVAAALGLVLVVLAEIVLLRRAATESRVVRDAIERARWWAALSTNEVGSAVSADGTQNLPVPSAASVPTAPVQSNSDSPTR